jgi:hypothetical protein
MVKCFICYMIVKIAKYLFLRQRTNSILLNQFASLSLRRNESESVSRNLSNRDPTLKCFAAAEVLVSRLDRCGPSRDDWNASWPLAPRDSCRKVFGRRKEDIWMFRSSESSSSWESPLGEPARSIDWLNFIFMKEESFKCF